MALHIVVNFVSGNPPFSAAVCTRGFPTASAGRHMEYIVVRSTTSQPPAMKGDPGIYVTTVFSFLRFSMPEESFNNSTPKPGHAVRSTIAREMSRSIMTMPKHLKAAMGLSEGKGISHGASSRGGETAAAEKPAFDLNVLSDTQRRRVEHVFNKFDRTGNGSIGKDEMRQVCSSRQNSRVHPDPTFSCLWGRRSCSWDIIQRRWNQTIS